MLFKSRTNYAYVAWFGECIKNYLVGLEKCHGIGYIAMVVTSLKTLFSWLPWNLVAPDTNILLY